MSEGADKATSKRNRSSSYPAMNLDKAIQSIDQIKDSLGLGPFDRESTAKALGYSGVSGTSSTAVAALVHFGLLERQGSVYEVSTLAENILTPREEKERINSRIEAALQPKLFRTLVNKYEGKSIPSMLDHILVRDHGIKEPAAGDVKKTFIATMTSVGLLENGVLQRVADTTAEPSDNLKIIEMPQEAIPNASIAPSTPQPTRTQEFYTGHRGIQPGASPQIQITGGFSLTYPGSLPYELLADEDFRKALADLKSAIESHNKDDLSPGSK